MNPSSEGLKDRAATSPALFNRCVLNWFGDWSKGALYQVGKEFTSKMDLEKGGVSTTHCSVHNSSLLLCFFDYTVLVGANLSSHYLRPIKSTTLIIRCMHSWRPLIVSKMLWLSNFYFYILPQFLGAVCHFLFSTASLGPLSKLSSGYTSAVSALCVCFHVPFLKCFSLSCYH